MQRKNHLITLAVCIIVAAIAIGAVYDLAMTASEKKEYPRKYAEYVQKWGAEYGVPEWVIYSVIKAESDFDPDTVSSANAVGLMQILVQENSNTFEYIATMVGDKYSPSLHFDPNTNIKYGTYYLSYLYAKFGDWSTVFAAYNAGEGNVASWLSDTEYSRDGKTLVSIPFSETEKYVKKVERYCDAYKRLYYR